MKLILVIYIPIQTKIVANIAKKDILYLNTAMNVKYVSKLLNTAKNWKMIFVPNVIIFLNLQKIINAKELLAMNMKNGKFKCYYGFYLFEEKECKKIPIQYCVVWDGKKCTKCNEGSEEDGNGGCKLIEENDDDEDEDKDDDKREDTGVEHCNSVSWSIGEKPECTGCEQNYELNELKTKCNYLCESTEEYCGQCKDNYYSFDGKTCEIIDPSYKESYAKLFNFNLVSFARILLLLI